MYSSGRLLVPHHFLSVHAPNEEKSDDSNDSFCEELEEVFCHFPKYHMESGLFFFLSLNLLIGWQLSI